MLDDTIAAIATPLGEGGLAVIRLSGQSALSIVDKSFVPIGKRAVKPSAAQTHTIHYGKIVQDGQPIDEVFSPPALVTLVVSMPSLLMCV
jgi:tRNA modification GTPase